MSVRAAKNATPLSEQAYTRLRNRILACEIEPGELVTESQLSAELQLGKTPIREALGRLASEGLVRPGGLSAQAAEDNITLRSPT